MRYSLNEFIERMPIYEDIEQIKPNMLEFAAMAKIIIRQQLDAQLGDKAKHVSVGFISGTPDYATLSFQAHDKVGSILLAGSPPHTITGDPVKFEKGGETVFATKIDHPGFEGMKEDVENIIYSGLEKAAYMVL